MTRNVISVLLVSVVVLAGWLAPGRAQSTLKITITGITPTTINPNEDESVRITFRTPTDLKPASITVVNAAGTVVRTIGSNLTLKYGSHSTDWDGRASTGAIVPNGLYTVVISGTAKRQPVQAGLAPVTVQTASTMYALSVTNVTRTVLDLAQNQSTVLTYTVPTPLASLTITVSNTAGGLIRTLATLTNVPAGTRTITWDGRDDAGQPVPNSSYTMTLAGQSANTVISVQSATQVITVQTIPITYTLSITDVTRTVINLSLNESTTLTYTIPTQVASLTIKVFDTAGNAVRALTTFTNIPAGTRTVTWDGRNDAGLPIDDGDYTITLTGQSANTFVTVHSATQSITVFTPPSPPLPSIERGNILEGYFAASYPNLRYPGIQFGVAFVAPRTGTLREITMQWKSSPGYGAGTGGLYSFEIRTNNAATNFPSDTVIGSVARIAARTAMDGYLDGAFHFPITASLTGGTIYHLVVTNADDTPLTNWASPNTLATRIEPWSGAGIGGAANGRAISSYLGSWNCWTTPEHPGSGGDYTVNGCHVPLMLSWTDAPLALGDPYYCALVNEEFAARLYGVRKAGELIVWTGETTAITRIGFPIIKVGAPTGDLRFHLDEVGRTPELASGIVTTAADSGTQPEWHYVSLAQPITLETGKTYRLWLEAPTGSNNANHYMQNVPYGESRPPLWLEGGWGGTTSVYTYNLGSGWNTWRNADLSFSLQ